MNMIYQRKIVLPATEHGSYSYPQSMTQLRAHKGKAYYKTANANLIGIAKIDWLGVVAVHECNKAVDKVGNVLE